ncbi:hypothetical protein PR002_g8376 [Phytophthora rubi]|uniref:Uncharacterized protein n=1 Tax=Phytophthora rubi TaxID=129364 RepID=A0A6A3MM77_9STRA|nr:hypothetical protein PR002_g8376 [Phytophthora rubi]
MPCIVRLCLRSATTVITGAGALVAAPRLFLGRLAAGAGNFCAATGAFPPSDLSKSVKKLTTLESVGSAGSLFCAAVAAKNLSYLTSAGQAVEMNASSAAITLVST